MIKTETKAPSGDQGIATGARAYAATRALRQIWALAAAAVLLAASAHGAPAALASAPHVVAIVAGEPNFSIDGQYQELDVGQLALPVFGADQIMLAPLNEIVLQLGGTVSGDAAPHAKPPYTARYRLAGRELVLTAGSTCATVNGQVRTLPLAPLWRDGVLWAPAAWVLQQFGAVTAWSEARQRFTATVALPASLSHAYPRGGPLRVRTMAQQSDDFYAGAGGRALADVILGYQNADGGWPKLEGDISLAVPLDPRYLLGARRKSTIDNDATSTELGVLARVVQAGGKQQARYRAAFERGVDYLLAAQQSNGGWPQFWPAPLGYQRHITLNDDAMVNVMSLLRDVRDGQPPYAFVDAGRRERAGRAVDAGVELLLRTQLVVAGKKAAWCAQYDEQTLAPASGRSFELASVSGAESVGVVRFLMSIEKPSAAVIAAVQDAVAWLAAARVTGLRRVRKVDHSLESGFDNVVVADAAAPPLWARFYDLERGKPVFAGRDGVPRTALADIPYERRTRYGWYSEAPRKLIEVDYPAWRAKLGLPAQPAA